jgi:putative membrane protein
MRGPVLLVARHAHHALDGEVLLAALNRPLHFVVAIDWATGRLMETVLTRACQMARWPMVIRQRSPFTNAQSARYARNYRAMRDALQLLKEKRAVVIFPEGFPNIDNNPTPKQGDDDMLPFEPGFARLAMLATRYDTPPVIIPVGFTYTRGERWSITARFGKPVEYAGMTTPDLIRHLEQTVQHLSFPETSGTT